MNEKDFEEKAIQVLQGLGYEHLRGGDQEFQAQRGDDLKKVLLKNRLLSALQRINPDVPDQALRVATQKLEDKIDESYSGQLEALNKEVYRMLTVGIVVEFKSNGEQKSHKVRCIDFDIVENNEFVVANQVSIKIQGKDERRRPDALLFVNGIPVVVFEFKDAKNLFATIGSAFEQVQGYRRDIPQLFATNQFIVLSDWTEARYGAPGSEFDFFSEWKKIEDENDTAPNNLETLLRGMCDKRRLLDILQHFISFDGANVKKICRYHQYYGVNNVFKKAEVALGSFDPKDKKLGVFWHTQGSGKTMSMLFLIQKVRELLPATTFVFVTDRNDLDNQARDTLQALGHFVQQSDSRKDLTRLIKEGGVRVIITTIQKFYEDKGVNEDHNIIVISDEAHRSQNKEQAGRMRDALPNASFLGITGTPISKDDKNTIQTFGDIVSKYTIDMAVRDKITVSIYHDLRYSFLGIKPEYEILALERALKNFDGYGDEVGFDANNARKSAYTKFTNLLQAKGRMQNIAQDIVDHFSQKQREQQQGKGMICTSSKQHAIKMYEFLMQEIRKQNANIEVAVVLSDLKGIEPGKIQKNRDVNALKRRFKQPDDPLNLVIVCDMWLTGFDVPCLTTMYIDKPLREHTLLQAVARVNRVFKDKQGGLIVDYIGIGSDLSQALSQYTSKYISEALVDMDELIKAMNQSLSEIIDMLGLEKIADNVDDFYSAYERVSTNKERMQEFLNKAKLFIRAYDIVMPHKQARDISKEKAFVQNIATALKKNKIRTINTELPPSHQDIQQPVDDAVYSEEVRLLFKTSQPIDILSPEFMRAAEKTEHKNVFIDTMRAIIEEKIDKLRDIDKAEGDKFRERLQKLIQQYEAGIFNTKALGEAIVSMGQEVAQVLKDDAGKSGLTREQKVLMRALEQYDGSLRNKDLREMVNEIIGTAQKDMTLDWSDNEMLSSRIRSNIQDYFIKIGVHDFAQAQEMAQVVFDRLVALYEDYVPGEKVRIR